jgi:dihydrofolate reductase
VVIVRKVVAYELLSLDGVAERPDGFFADWDDAMDANLGAIIAAQDSVILGRRSYEEWAGFWPGSDIEPFATFINGVTKYVATSTALDRSWANATVVDGDLAGFVRELRNQPGADIGVHASISVTQALLAAGVVDELRLVIAPVIAGSGRRLLEACQRSGSNRSGARPRRLATCSSTTASSGRRAARLAGMLRCQTAQRIMSPPITHARRRQMT